MYESIGRTQSLSAKVQSQFWFLLREHLPNCIPTEAPSIAGEVVQHPETKSVMAVCHSMGKFDCAYYNRHSHEFSALLHALHTNIDCYCQIIDSITLGFNNKRG